MIAFRSKSLSFIVLDINTKNSIIDGGSSRMNDYFVRFNISYLTTNSFSLITLEINTKNTKIVGGSSRLPTAIVVCMTTVDNMVHVYSF